jgi:hypothetical protein
MKLIALDMDGVVNSNILIRKWFIDKEKELFELTNKQPTDTELRNAFKEEFKNSTELIFPQLAKYITEICEKTNAYILWTSTWRKLEKYSDINVAKDMFNRHGLPGDKLIGYTPQIGMSWYGRSRGSEIRLWLKNNNLTEEITHCAVIDDRVDAGENLPINAKFFWIDPNQGISNYETINIINYLNENYTNE